MLSSPKPLYLTAALTLLGSVMFSPTAQATKLASCLSNCRANHSIQWKDLRVCQKKCYLKYKPDQSENRHLRPQITLEDPTTGPTAVEMAQLQQNSLAPAGVTPTLPTAAIQAPMTVPALTEPVTTTGVPASPPPYDPLRNQPSTVNLNQVIQGEGLMPSVRVAATPNQPQDEATPSPVLPMGETGAISAADPTQAASMPTGMAAEAGEPVPLGSDPSLVSDPTAEGEAAATPPVPAPQEDDGEGPTDMMGNYLDPEDLDGPDDTLNPNIVNGPAPEGTSYDHTGETPQEDRGLLWNLL